MRRSTQLISLTLLSASLMGMTGCQSIKNNGLFKSKKSDTISTAKKTEAGYYDAAQRSLDKGNYSQATKELNDLRTFYPVGKFSEQALLDLMYAQYEHSDFLDAVASAERFIQLYPTNPQVDYAYYVRGVANMQSGFQGVLRYTDLNQAHRDMGYSRIAFMNFQDLISRYPNSPYAPDAAQRMRYIYNQMAESEMDTARWYIKRKAYVAAANRAKGVFQYYPQSVQIPEAIATLAESYQRLGMTDTANQYKQLLTINYPQMLDRNGNVKLSNALTKPSLLNKVTLGVLGRSATNANIKANTQYPVATKPQVIQSIQQALTLQLPQQATSAFASPTTASPTVSTAPNNSRNGVNFGLALPANVVDNPSGKSSTTSTVNQGKVTNNALPSKTPTPNPMQNTGASPAVADTISSTTGTTQSNQPSQ